MDPGRLKQSFARVAQHGDEVALFFYSDLFLRHPEVRDMFPVSMAVQRDRLLQALGRIVSETDRLEELTPFLQDLGRDHRKFGALADHYGPVGESLLATLAHFSGPDWSAELAAEWTAAYGLVAQVMSGAAAEHAREMPPYWEATVVAHELRSFDIGVFRVALAEPLRYEPGQSVAFESSLRPRIWRLYSIANAPREDGTLDFHVQMHDGGTLSMPLVRSLEVGARLRLGPPVGHFTLRQPPRRSLLLVAGGTGIAPVKAITEQLAQLGDPPATRLFFGARQTDSLYELPELEKIAANAPWLRVTGCVSEDRSFPGEHGLLPDVVARSGSWPGHDAYIAGPTQMVEAMTARLEALGVPQEQIFAEDFGWSMS
jgi:NAD(P)H-flavin reductase/hemoglobin-like flavoprotein